MHDRWMPICNQTAQSKIAEEANKRLNGQSPNLKSTIRHQQEEILKPTPGMTRFSAVSQPAERQHNEKEKPEGCRMENHCSKAPKNRIFVGSFSIWKSISRRSSTDKGCLFLTHDKMDAVLCLLVGHLHVSSPMVR